MQTFRVWRKRWRKAPGSPSLCPHGTAINGLGVSTLWACILWDKRAGQRGRGTTTGPGKSNYQSQQSESDCCDCSVRFSGAFFPPIRAAAATASFSVARTWGRAQRAAHCFKRSPSRSFSCWILLRKASKNTSNLIVKSGPIFEVLCIKAQTKLQIYS